MLDDIVEQRIAAGSQIGVFQLDYFRAAHKIGNVLIAESRYPVGTQKHFSILLNGYQYGHNFFKQPLQR